ncbi:MAG: putative 4-hydroxybenzoate polyprenyltransferase [Ignavibacteriales bacterium]|nr:putative 4-hydroxybenzoate polyprenyltransferase [Ignavibacteriales bacterium]
MKTFSFWLYTPYSLRVDSPLFFGYICIKYFTGTPFTGRKLLKKILRFIKIEHTLFSLPMIYSGVFLASRGTPSLRLLILVLLAAVGARTVAMTLNRIFDRHIDARNPRTHQRELPSGKLTMTHGYGILAAGFVLYLGAAWSISDFCFFLSPIPLLVFTIYPYLKRFTALAHFGVGLGLAMGPLGGWFAVTGSTENFGTALLLPLFTLCWATGFDIIYSTLDEEFDKSEDLFSFPSRFGKKRALQISAALHVIAFILLLILFFTALHGIWAAPLLVLSGLLLYFEQKKADDVELAFFKINIVIGFTVFAMVVVSNLFP